METYLFRVGFDCFHCEDLMDYFKNFFHGILFLFKSTLFPEVLNNLTYDTKMQQYPIKVIIFFSFCVGNFAFLGKINLIKIRG